MRTVCGHLLLVASTLLATVGAAHAGTSVSVPEPISLSLLGAGVAGVLVIRRLRKR